MAALHKQQECVQHNYCFLLGSQAVHACTSGNVVIIIIMIVSLCSYVESIEVVTILIKQCLIDLPSLSLKKENYATTNTILYIISLLILAYDHFGICISLHLFVLSCTIIFIIILHDYTV